VNKLTYPRQIKVMRLRKQHTIDMMIPT